MKKLLAGCVLLGLLSSCWSPQSETVPYASLERIHQVFVQHELTDGVGVDGAIVRELQKMGYTATAGPITMLPDSADAVLSYQAEWTEDFTNYVIRLDMQLRDAHSGKPLAAADYFRPSFVGEPVDRMARTVLKKLLHR